MRWVTRKKLLAAGPMMNRVVDTELACLAHELGS